MAHANDLDKLIHAIHSLISTMIEIERNHLIAQATLDASVAGLTSAVNNAVAALAAGSPTTSTPDTVVSAYQAAVDAQALALATATPAAVAAAAAK